MTDQPANLPFYPARWKHSGRLKPVRLLVIHSAEGATTAPELGHYFEHAVRKGSSHLGVGQDGSIGRYVHDADTAFGAAGANSDGIHIELCGFARWTAEQWRAHDLMLRTAAKVAAEVCRGYGLPIARLGKVSVADGHTKGITGHDTVSAAFPKQSTGHTDPGPAFPWADFLSMMRQSRPATRNPYAQPAVPPNFGKGATGTKVKWVQWALGYTGAALDGKFGPHTETSLRSFQQRRRLTVDGVVGPQTSAALARVTR